MAGDMAAGIVIVREAGGYVSDCDGGSDPMRSRSICCGNEALQRELLGLIKHANRPVIMAPPATMPKAAHSKSA